MKGSLSIYISVKSISSKALFNATISLLISCLEDLSIFDSGVLKSPAIIAVNIFLEVLQDFLYVFGCSMLGAYIFTMFMSSWWILPLSIMKLPSGSLFMALFLKSILSDMSIATPAFSFPVHLLGKFDSLSVCVDLLSSGGSLVGSICLGHVFLSIQLFYVF